MGAGLRRSVVLEQRQQVVAAVARQIRGAQVGQQLIGVGQLRKKLQRSHDIQLGDDRYTAS